MRFRWIERIAVLLTSLVLSIGLIVLLSGYFTNRDQAGVSGAANRIGEAFPDLGDAKLTPGSPHPRYNSDPPTSGPHVPVTVSRENVRLSDDELLSALAAGDIVIDYGGAQPPAGLEAVATQMAGPFTPALAAAGQAVVLAKRPHTVGLTAVAWTRTVQVSAPQDALLRQFIESWLGRGADGHP